VLAAWKRAPLDAPALREVQRAERSATFGLDHGRAEIRIEATPYDGSSWPRWSRALYVNDTALYDVSSGCGTCRTILHLAGALERYRASLERIDAVDEEKLAALRPLIDRLQTGRCLAALTDLAIERVDVPTQSWLARYYIDCDELAPGNDGVAYAPRVTLFQSRDRAPQEAQSAFFVFVPGQDLAKLDQSRVREYERAIRDGRRPAAIALTWVEDRPTDWDEERIARAVRRWAARSRPSTRCAKRLLPSTRRTSRRAVD
jgi:hypothetical protein